MKTIKGKLENKTRYVGKNKFGNDIMEIRTKRGKHQVELLSLTDLINYYDNKEISFPLQGVHEPSEAYKLDLIDYYKKLGIGDNR